jgi:heptaprenyl diphosphate synthase
VTSTSTNGVEASASPARANGRTSALGEGGEAAIALSTLSSESPLWESCDYIVSNPGKRFRASVLECSAHYGDRPEDPLVGRSAVAIELFHAATLAHDDVVDDGNLRRGKATIGARSGNLAASLAGGWLFARAGELIAEVDGEAIARFAEATSIVCEGEMLESRDLHDVDRTRESYLASIEAKTARLIAFSAWLGGKVGGADSEVAERLERYGEAVGMAFQIADDVLDLLADPKTTGKTEGSDLRGGVYTLPVIQALAVDPGLRERLLERPDESELPGVVAQIRATGAVETSLDESRIWIERALEALPLSDPKGEHEERLFTLADEVRERAEEVV